MSTLDEGHSHAEVRARNWLVYAGTATAWAFLFLAFKLKHYELAKIPLVGLPFEAVISGILVVSFVFQIMGLVRLRSVLPGAALEMAAEAVVETLNVICFNLPAGRPVKWIYERFVAFRKKREGSAEFFKDPPPEWLDLYNCDRECFYKFTVGSRDGERIPQCVIFDNTRTHIPLTNVLVKWDSKDEWSVSPKLKSQTSRAGDAFEKWARRHDHDLYDGLHLRLRAITRESDRLILAIQPVRYFDSFYSNNVQDHVSAMVGGVALRRKLCEGGKLESLEESTMANLFGVNHLIVTFEGDLVVAERSRGVAIRPGYLAPSAAGDFDYDDFGPPSEALTTCFSDHSTSREVAAELGSSVAESLSEQVFLGIAREIARGGKPDSFFAATSSLTFAQIEKSRRLVRDRWEGVQLHRITLGDPARRRITSCLEAYQMLRTIEDFVAKFSLRVSPTLAMNLEFWIRYKLAQLD